MTPTEFFKYLSDDIRLKTLLLIINEEELCVCELMVALEENSQPKVSRHLAQLKTAGILITRKQKQWVYYAINPELPSWQIALLTQTKNENQLFLSSDVERLAKMGERPERLKTCCN